MSSLLAGGERERALHVSNSRDGSRKMTAEKEGSFGSENLDIISNKKIIRSRSLRLWSRKITPPPAPTKNRPTSMSSTAPPPSVV